MWFFDIKNTHSIGFLACILKLSCFGRQTFLVLVLNPFYSRFCFRYFSFLTVFVFMVKITLL